MSLNPLQEALIHAASGSIGTATSTALLAPLDLITTRLKVQRQLEGQENYDGIIDAFRSIIRQDGVKALYRGAGTDILKSLIDSFLFFGFYNYFRQRQRNPKIAQELLYGMTAGALAKACTMPLSNAVARKQTSDTDKNLLRILSNIKREGGFLALWAGYSATLVLTLNPSLTFLINRRLASKIIPALQDEDIPTAWAAFLIAACSKSVATAATYPFQTAKARLQTQNKSTDEKNSKSKDLKEPSEHSAVVDLFNKTVLGLVVGIIAKEGVRVLYDGIRGEILKGFLSHGLTMACKGFIHRLFFKLIRARLQHLRIKST